MMNLKQPCLKSGKRSSVLCPGGNLMEHFHIILNFSLKDEASQADLKTDKRILK